ncbi:MAG: hydrolase 1, exosortase A system-associated [Pseudomonadota bacterium]
METFMTLGKPGHELTAILHRPDKITSDRAVVIVVGGPQYRVGSHRMFVLLARAFADAGIPALRFDFRGMGDSAGDFPGFDQVSDDLKIACDGLLAAVPECISISLAGLCDGASAAAIYADRDDRVQHVLLLNPWVHTEAGEAKAFVWYYYPRRLMQADFWRGFFSGKVNVLGALGGLLSKLRQATGRRAGAADEEVGFIERMRRGLERFTGRTDILLSDTDLTAAEFRDLTKSDAAWANVVQSADVCAIESADHTFARQTSLSAMISRSVSVVKDA